MNKKILASFYQIFFFTLAFSFFLTNQSLAAACPGTCSDTKPRSSCLVNNSYDCGGSSENPLSCWICDQSSPATTAPATQAATNTGTPCPGTCVTATNGYDSCPSPSYRLPEGICGSAQICCVNSNQCIANGGFCANSCSELISNYNNACPSGQVCCKTANTGTTTGSGGTTPGTGTNTGSGGTTAGTGTMGGIAIPTDTGLPDPPGGVLLIITNLLDWLLTVFLVLAVMAFVLTGVQYLLSMGNSRSGLLEGAKNNFQYAIMAIVIVGASLIIIKAINNFLNASPLI